MNWWVGVAFGVTVLVSGVVAAVLWRWLCNAVDELKAKHEDELASAEASYCRRVEVLNKLGSRRDDELAEANKRIKTLEDTVRRLVQDAKAIQTTSQQALGGSMADSGLMCKGGNHGE